MEGINDYIKAGNIAKKAMEYGLSLIVENAKYYDIISKTEKKIYELGGKLACPTTLSVNEIAAHDTADTNDPRIIKKGDVVKLDMGVHINGFIADMARSIEVSTKKYENLINASRQALERAKKTIRKDIRANEIGRVIEEEISKFGFQPITNLSGHRLDKFTLHSGINIPNFSNGNKNIITEGAYAIEPFATNGSGTVVDVNTSLIFQLIDKRMARLPKEREVIKFIESEFGNFPFSKRSIEEHFNKNLMFIIVNLTNKGVLRNYEVLREAGKGIVSQTEDTIIVSDKIICTTSDY